jgi:DNA polymerase III subunit gamma/tau
MSLDTKYRPSSFNDVLGQEGSIRVLREYVKTGTGFHQSYLFAGPFGSGKTTLARILARALLCDNVSDKGDPCNVCPSCTDILNNGASANFVEIDAATNSGKQNVKNIVDRLSYSSMNGKKTLYLFDEAHRLTTEALDGLLKPMEDNDAGSENKKLVCIFCTTEPEGMRQTILSRCAPAFIIKQVAPTKIADRLEYVCGEESLPFEREALELIGEVSDCHIRDALKAVEGVSMLGEVNLKNTRDYLQVGKRNALIDVLRYVGENLSKSLTALNLVKEYMSPAICYDYLLDLCMEAIKLEHGVGKVKAFWEKDKIEDLVQARKDYLALIMSHISSKPFKPTFPIIVSDIVFLHNLIDNGTLPHQIVLPATATKAGESSNPPEQAKKTEGVDAESLPVPYVNKDKVFVDPRAVRKSAPSTNAKKSLDFTTKESLGVQEFLRLVGMRMSEEMKTWTDETNQHG